MTADEAKKLTRKFYDSDDMDEIYILIKKTAKAGGNRILLFTSNTTSDQVDTLLHQGYSVRDDDPYYIISWK